MLHRFGWYGEGAQKYAQLGQDAFEKILDAATQGIIMPDRAFMVFAEVNMLFGDMFDAFVEKRGQWNFPTYLFTATSSEAHYDWWMHEKRNLLTDEHLAGTLQVAGFQPLSETIPQDVMEKPPVPPPWHDDLHRAC